MDLLESKWTTVSPFQTRLSGSDSWIGRYDKVGWEQMQSFLRIRENADVHKES